MAAPSGSSWVTVRGLFKIRYGPKATVGAGPEPAALPANAGAGTLWR
jgi:hypothetical protein